MTEKEVFTELRATMVEGMMIHEQLANYYDFLGMKGYKRLHEYQFVEESMMLRKLSRYYINHLNALIPDKQVEDPKAIPDDWYMHIRDDVTPDVKKSAVKTAMTKWVNWEKKVKALMESAHKDLIMEGKASAMKIKKFLKDVDKEMKCAHRMMLELQAVDFDMIYIIDSQQHIHDKYKEKMEHIGKCLT